ncbi:MAG: hypothetical protein ACI9KR_000695 [Arcticibacterium sp.]|jgi:hypothetical protein
MLVPFQELPEDARIWIYQSNRPFNTEEAAAVKAACDTFLNGWTAHEAALHAGVDMPYNRFIIFGLDAQQGSASGCSIDASVRFIQKLEALYGVDLLDKMNVTYKQGPHLAHKQLNDFKKMAKDRAVNGNTIVFNNLVNTKGEYDQFWEVPASESWHGQFMKA